MRKQPSEPLQPFDGEVSVPCWALRPGGVSALKKAARGIPLWLAIRSSNGRKLRPCTASRDTLAATLGISTRTLGSQLEALRAGKGLLIEFKRPADRETGQLRPPVRFAVEPLRWWRERPLLEAGLPKIAEADGLGTAWLRRALRLVEHRDSHIRRLAHAISSEIYSADPRAKSAPGAISAPRANLASNEGGGGVGGPEPSEAEAEEEVA
jgi:hypothetical protein